MPDEFDHDLRAAVQQTGAPPGAFGRLERIARKVARLQRRRAPQITLPGLLVIAGDHGIAQYGISSTDRGRTRVRAEALASGQGLVARLAQEAGLAVRVVDAGLSDAAEAGSLLLDRRIGPGSAPLLNGPAMTGAQCNSAMAAGEALAAQSPHDCLGLADMSRGGEEAAVLLVHRLTGAPLDKLVVRGDGLDEEGLFRQHALLSRAASRVPRQADSKTVLAEFGGFEIAMLSGAMIGAAQRGKLVLVDGFGATVAALIAARLVPESRRAMVFCNLIRAPGHRVALDSLAARPLLQLDVDMADGAGVVLAWPLVRSAMALLAQDQG